MMIGIDTVKISRIINMIEKWGDKAINRFLSPSEKLLIKNKSSYAGYWAAKEAASKAIGTGIGKYCAFHDIKLTKSPLGQPLIKYKKHIRKKFNIKSSSLSITHDGEYAIAVVVNQLK